METEDINKTINYMKIEAAIDGLGPFNGIFPALLECGKTFIIPKLISLFKASSSSHTSLNTGEAQE